MWTQFWDMNSGGGRKEDVSQIYIEANEQEATSVFFARFGHNPNRVTCTCCGSDYSISEYDTLEHATAFQRGLRSINSPDKNDYGYSKTQKYIEPGEEIPEGWTLSPYGSLRYDGDGMTLAEYIASGECKIIYAAEITPAERSTAVPTQGYVWED